MTRRRQDQPKATAALLGRVLGCFDKDLCVRRNLFEDALTICELATEGPLEIAAGTGTIRFGRKSVDVSGVIEWLSPFANGRGYTYYIHHHDNIVKDVALFEPFERAAFRRRLRLFRTSPAAEGGANLLGVVDGQQAWVLVLENDNQGEFRFEFFGPKDMVCSLRSYLTDTLTDASKNP